jgi:hypothetical protein
VRAGEAEFTNPNNPLDVNNDGYVTPMDALFVMNFLNAHGPVDLKGSSGSAEGESGAVLYYDTNADGIISPLDILPIINHLNLAARDGAQGGQGEGEAKQAAASEIVALVVDPPAVAAIIGLVDASEARRILAEAEVAERLSTIESIAVPDDVYRTTSQDDGEDADDLNWWLEDEMIEDIAQAWQIPDDATGLLEMAI